MRYWSRVSGLCSFSVFVFFFCPKTNAATRHLHSNNQILEGSAYWKVKRPELDGLGQMRVPEVVLNCTQYSQDWRGRRGDQRKKKKKRKKVKKFKNKIKTRSWYSWYSRIPSHRNLFNSFIISGISGEYRHFRSPLEFFHQPVKKGEKKKKSTQKGREIWRYNSQASAAIGEAFSHGLMTCAKGVLDLRWTLEVIIDYHWTWWHPIVYEWSMIYSEYIYKVTLSSFLFFSLDIKLHGHPESAFP